MNIKKFTTNVLEMLAHFNAEFRGKSFDMTQEQWSDEFARFAMKEVAIQSAVSASTSMRQPRNTTQNKHCHLYLVAPAH